MISVLYPDRIDEEEKEELKIKKINDEFVSNTAKTLQETGFFFLILN